MEISKHIIEMLWPLKVRHLFHTKAENYLEEEKDEEEARGGGKKTKRNKKEKKRAGAL